MTATLEQERDDATAAARPWWRRRWMPVPVSVAYILVLLILGTLLSAQSSRDQTEILLHLSTNLHNLTRGHFATLISSAFVTDGPAWLMVPLLGCVLVLAELRFGSRRMVETFMAGHIGATLLVAVGLLAAVHLGWIAPGVGSAKDVGVSYGTMALIGAFLVFLPKRARLPWMVSWLVIGAAGVAVGQTFTNVGHFVALLIGFAFAGLMIRGNWLGRIGHAMTKLDVALLTASTAVGGCFLLA